MVKKGMRLLLFLVFCYLAWIYTPAGEHISLFLYDWKSSQEPVWTQKGIDEALLHFDTIQYEELDAKFRTYIQPLEEEAKGENLLKKQRFYIIQGHDFFKYVSGDFRIRDFLPRDSYYYRSLRPFSINKTQYLLIDKKLLYKVLELQNLLHSKGYNETGFWIVNGFRHPRYNDEVGGASEIRHMLGQAVDLGIGDINLDGWTDEEDKRLLFELLDEQVIRNQGGIGRYPSAMNLHFDVRGYRARWDEQ